MSAFFFAMNRNGSSFDYDIADSMMSQLDVFGEDFSQLIVKDHYAIAYQARWAVPEEQGEQQPLYDDGQHYFIFLGRVDNRQQIMATLGVPGTAILSDAQLVWRYVLKYGAERLHDIIGPFVFVAFDTQKNEVLLARDAMGGRYIVSQITDEYVLIASYEMALVAHPSVSYQINAEKVALSLSMQLETQTLASIEGLIALEPGFYLLVNAQQTVTKRFYQALPKKRIQLGNNQAYADEFRRLLDQAVERRMRTIKVTATMMSGGLDSVPIAIAASCIDRSHDRQHQALSWVFDRFEEADERQYSEPVCAEQSILQHQINCDDVWPQFDDDTHLNPVYPISIPYSEFQQATFRRAQQENVGTILSGIHGDVLYGHAEGLLYESISSGDWRSAKELFKFYWQHTASKVGLIKNLLIKPSKLFRLVTRWRRRVCKKRPSMLNSQLASQLPYRQHPLERESSLALRPRQWQNLFDGTAGSDMALGRVMEAKYQIDRRYPMRDRDLCEFMAAIPSEQLINGLVLRPIVLTAFNKELPEKLRLRNTKTSFQSVINKQISNDQNAQYWLDRSSAWHHYVKQYYFDNSAVDLNIQGLVQWRCAYYNFWQHTCYDEISKSLEYDI